MFNIHGVSTKAYQGETKLTGEEDTFQSTGRQINVLLRQFTDASTSLLMQVQVY